MSSSSRSRRRLAAALALVALTTAACSKSSSPEPVGDEAAVKATLEASIAAENNKDVEAFLVHWTDAGLQSYDVGSREELIDNEDFGKDKIIVRDFPEIEVTGETANVTVDATVGEAVVALTVFRVKFALIKEADSWKIDGFTFVGSPPPSEGTTVLDIEADEYSFTLSSETAPGDVAFKFRNVGEESHEISLFLAPEGVDLETATEAIWEVDGSSLDNLPEGYEAAHVAFANAGEEADVSFGEDLASGTYVLACFIPEGGEESVTGAPHIKLGMTALLEIE